MNLDVFGKVSSAITEYVLFYDESECNKSRFQYHAYLFVKKSEGENILKELIKIKSTYYSQDKEMHFNKIRYRSEQEHGNRAGVAVHWIKKCKVWLYNNQVKFYFFGVDKNNLKNFWRNDKSFDLNVYIRFFEMGLKTAVRWFAEGDKAKGRELCVTHMFYDQKDSQSDAFRREKAIKISRLLEETRKAGIIKINKIMPLDSDSNVSKTPISNFIQLVDILCGACRASFVQVAPSKQGQQECVDEFISVVEGFNCNKKAYNKNARYYKKFALQFFPRESNINLKEFLSKGTYYNHFYRNRPTFREKGELAKQINLFDLIT